MSTASETVDEAQEGTTPRPSLVLRLKRLLVAPLLLLRRLRQRKTADTPDEDAAPGRSRSRREEAEAVDAAPAGPPLWRRALPYAVVFALGAMAAGGAVSWLSGQIIARQSAGLAELEEEVTRLKGVLAGYDRMMLQNRKKLEEEQGRRAEAENRLGMAQTDLARRQQAPPASAPGARPAAGGAQGKAVDCTLRPGSVGSTLKGCIEEFNR